MEKIKQIMGGRCFLPDEAEELIGLQHREVVGIPKLTGRQIEQLEHFLKSTCPITGKSSVAETHILFPQPSTIAGSTFGMKWILANSRREWKIELSGLALRQPVPDRFYNKVRNPQWFLMFWGPEDQSAVPKGTEIEKLMEVGYNKPDLAIYTLALGYMKNRGVNVSCGGLCSKGTSVTLLDGLHAVRTVNAGLNIYTEEDSPPALVRKVPLC